MAENRGHLMKLNLPVNVCLLLLSNLINVQMMKVYAQNLYIFIQSTTINTNFDDRREANTLYCGPNN